MRTLTVEGLETFEELVQLYKQEKHKKRKRWLHILVLMLEGRNAIEIADILKMSPEAVRRVVRKYNKSGVDSLYPKTSSGRPKALTPEQEDQLYDLIIAGPEPEDHVTNWTGKIIQKKIEKKFGVWLGLSTVYALLHRLGFSWLSPRPKNPKQQEEEKQKFKKKLSRNWGAFTKNIPPRLLKSGYKMKCE